MLSIVVSRIAPIVAFSAKQLLADKKFSSSKKMNNVVLQDTKLFRMPRKYYTELHEYGETIYILCRLNIFSGKDT